jgi:hypothetical protein
MSATAQPEPRQTASAAINAEARPPALSDEKFWKDRQLKVEEFIKLCEEMSAEAEANGLTDEILAGILADK